MLIPSSSESSSDFYKFDGEVPDLEWLNEVEIPSFEMTSEIAHMIMGGFFEGIAHASEEELQMYVNIWDNVIPESFKEQVAAIMQDAVAKLQEDYDALDDEEQVEVDEVMTDFYCNELSETKQQMVEAALQVSSCLFDRCMHHVL